MSDRELSELSEPATFEHMGKQITMKQLSRTTRIPIMTLYKRWNRGDRGDRLSRPMVRKVTR